MDIKFAGALLAGGLLLKFLLQYVTRKQLSPNAFKGRRIVITGASSGIGAALSVLLSRLGADLVLAARREDLLASVKNACVRVSTGSNKIFTVQCDVSNKADNDRLMSKAAELLGGLDHVLLNAGLGANDTKFQETQGDFTQFQRIMDVNYWGVVYGAYYALAHLQAAGKSSKQTPSIMITGSLAGLMGTPGRTGYSPGKFALMGFSEALRHEVAPAVGVQVVCPGYVITEIHDTLLAKGVKRNPKKFMTAETAAEIMAAALLNGDRVVVMTAMAKFGQFFKPIIPSWLLDAMVARGSKAAFVKEE